jgi:predicted phage gp36 major capsid-like protein
MQESDKRNKKATVVNRNGDVEVMDLSKALTMSATETVDKVDDYYEKFKDELPKKNKSIQRLARAHGLDSDEDSGDEIPKG